MPKLTRINPVSLGSLHPTVLHSSLYSNTSADIFRCQKSATKITHCQHFLRESSSVPTSFSIIFLNQRSNKHHSCAFVSLPFLFSPHPWVGVPVCDHVALKWPHRRRQGLEQTGRGSTHSRFLSSFPPQCPSRVPGSPTSGSWVGEVSESKGWSVRERGGRPTREVPS